MGTPLASTAQGVGGGCGKSEAQEEVRRQCEWLSEDGLDRQRMADSAGQQLNPRQGKRNKKAERSRRPQ